MLSNWPPVEISRYQQETLIELQSGCIGRKNLTEVALQVRDVSAILAVLSSLTSQVNILKDQVQELQKSSIKF